MPRNTRQLEILFAVFLILMGIVSSYLVYHDISSRIEFIRNYTDLPTERYWMKFLVNKHLEFIVNVLLLLGGVFLLLRLKIGWYFALIGCTYSFISWTMFALTSPENEPLLYWMDYAIGLLFLLMVFYFLGKSNRESYSINGRSYLIVIVGIAVLIVDRIFL